MSDDPEVDNHDDEGRVTSPYRDSPTTDTPTKARTYAMSSMRTSRDGFAFIVTVEGRGRETDSLHWPLGSSGVTLGFGYDFRYRTPSTIIADLTSIGISRKIAEILSHGSGLHGASAKNFVKDFGNLISLTDRQKQDLLQKISTDYENRIKKAANFSVTQYQFDALVSLAYDPGGHIEVITRSIAQGNLAQAEKDWLSRTHSGYKNSAGLVNRRKREINLYNNGVYK